MPALVKSHAAKGLELMSVAVPEIGPRDLLIKITKTAICGTDLHIYNWDSWSQKNVKPPTTLGHEFVGVVEQVGLEVEDYKPGDRVSGEGHLVCGRCRNCRAGRKHLCIQYKGIGIHTNGAFAEYIAFPASNAFKIENSVKDQVAAIFDPFGNAVHTVLAFDVTGEDVLITGAGPIGLMAVSLCRHIGARHIVISDVNDYRLEIARKLGASKAVNINQSSLSDTMQDLEMKEGFDVAFEMSGHEGAFENILSSLIHGGKIASLGIFPSKVTVDWNLLVSKGIEVKGIYGRQMYDTWYKMSSLLSSGLDISSVITHEFSFDEYEKAFQLLQSGQAGKVVLDWAK
ncbi:MAG: L-threonine 3-dehydrogenase [Zetaproteobacteria bacterium]|nr:L-threonine 3-dehydrogenase [Pseudobdellovibrionaceae bacterium]